MSWWLVPLFSWIGGWIFTICIHNIAIFSAKKQDKNWRNNDYLAHFVKEISENGNNLFTSGIIYFMANLFCWCFYFPMLRWGLMAFGIIFALPSIYSLCRLILQKKIDFKNKYATLGFMSAFIKTFVPLVMAINIYFAFIK